MEREKRERDRVRMRKRESECDRERWRRERERELVGEIIECERESGKEGWILKNAAKMKKLESALSPSRMCCSIYTLAH